MILITGAAGKTGRAVIQALAARGEEVRALVHRPEQTRPVTELGAHEVVVGDMRHPATMRQAMSYTRAVYHICPNVTPDELGIGETAIAAARSAGVEHFCFHSVLHPHTKEMPHHWHKLRVEELLLKSGLGWTILQPAAYMQNMLAYRDSITEQGIYPVPYPAETRLSLVDLQDVAEVAATVLARPEHAGATYQLVGTGPMTQTELAVILSQRLGRPVRAHSVTVEEWEQNARAAGLDPYRVDTLSRMFRYYAQYGLFGNPRVLAWLLERPPTSFADFVARAQWSQN
ncbi:MAG: NmrA family NAD(P)-binding protein [Chloroflexi bacterium]|nr:NmrA family NAD(P)-binding protein [Chloroflexota bacterium]